MGLLQNRRKKEVPAGSKKTWLALLYALSVGMKGERSVMQEQCTEYKTGRNYTPIPVFLRPVGPWIYRANLRASPAPDRLPMTRENMSSRTKPRL